MKKFILSALLGTTSAYDSFMAHDLEGMDIDTSLMTGEIDLATTIDSTTCQPFSGYDLYNLKDFDGLDRSVTKKTPADLTATGGDRFFYKTCQPTWTLTAPEVGVTTIDSSCDDMTGTAYLVNSAGKCVQSFEDSEFTGIADPSSSKNLTMGFDLVFSSKEACTADSTKNYTVTISAYCMNPNTTKSTGTTRVVDYDATKFGKFLNGTSTTCSTNFDYYGKEACKLYTFEIKEALEFVSKFAGVFLIVGGLLFVFAGSKLVIYGFTALVFLLTTGFLFASIYNLALPVSTSGLVLAGVFLACCLLGGVAAYYGRKFFDNYGVALISACGGIVVAIEIIQIITDNGIAEVTAVFIGAILGFYFGTKINLLAKSVTTALIGAFLTVRGIKCYTVGLADTKVNGTKVEPLIELGSIVLLTIIGTIVQFKYLKREEDAKDDDYMAAEDEGKTCGCF